jgi:outer membrane immunogenic protein
MQLVPFGFPPGLSDTTSVKTTWDSSIRARLGYLVTPSFLAYVTGGPAWQRLQLSTSCGTSCPFSFGPAPIAPVSASTSVTKQGWTLGAGGEVKAWGNWMVRGDYSYTSFRNIGFNYAYGTATGTAAPLGVGYGTSLKLNTHTITAGLSYKF